VLNYKMKEYLKLDRINIEFSDFKIEDVSFSLEKGKTLVLLGPSGSGKSSLIQAICGIVPISSGNLLVNGQIINEQPIHKRKIGIVFQDFALFPHLNVFDNIAFGLRIKHKSKAEIKERVSKLLNLIELDGYEKRKVYQLSGGEKQRVALARTLAADPEIILFDEPMSALDENLRDRLRSTIKKVLSYLNLTAIYVTHDQNEAFFMGHYIAVMHEGKLIAYDTSENIYKNPKSLICAEFLGVQNIFDAVVKEKKLSNYLVSFNGLDFIVNSDLDLKQNDKVKLLIKSESGLLSKEKHSQNSYEVKISNYTINGPIAEFILDLNGQKLHHKSFRTISLQNINSEQLYYNVHSEGISLVKE